MERLREVEISLDDNVWIVELDQGDMDEDTFLFRAIDYVLSNIQVEVL